MRIGIDGRVASRHFPGIGRYGLNLIAELLEAGSDHELFVIYDPRRTPDLAELARASTMPLLCAWRSVILRWRSWR